MFKKVYSLYFAFCTQPAFYSQSALCILHTVCILPLVRSLRFTLTAVSTHLQQKNQWYCYRIFLGQQKGCLCVLLYSDYMLRTVSIFLFFFFIDNKLTTLIHSRK